jgi:hypothetical protein
MADEPLYFFTVEDDVDPTQDSGGNGFPFPFFTGAQDVFPIPIAYDDCVEMYWRIKNWDISTDIVFSLSGVDTPMTSGDMTPDPGNAQAWADLETAGGSLHTFTLNTTETTLQLSAPIKLDSGNYLPQIFMVTVLAANVGRVSFQSTPPSGIYVSAGTVTGSIIDFFTGNTYPITVYLYVINGSGATMTGSSFVLKPIEWWPYANSQGLPVWDSSTGAQLNPPRS